MMLIPSLSSHTKKSKSVKKSKRSGGKRKLTAYTRFVKANIHKFGHLHPKERISACAKLWRQSH